MDIVVLLRVTQHPTDSTQQTTVWFVGLRQHCCELPLWTGCSRGRRGSEEVTGVGDTPAAEGANQTGSSDTAWCATEKQVAATGRGSGQTLALMLWRVFRFPSNSCGVCKMTLWNYEKFWKSHEIWVCLLQTNRLCCLNPYGSYDLVPGTQWASLTITMWFHLRLPALTVSVCLMLSVFIQKVVENHWSVEILSVKKRGVTQVSFDHQWMFSDTGCSLNSRWTL